MKKLLSIPLRLAVGWGWQPRWLSVLAIAMLVILRMTIGWHFYSEGVEKRDQGDWTAAPFFANARGPFEREFRAMVWDADGFLRLDRKATMVAFATFKKDVGDHYKFDKTQQTQAHENYRKAIEQFDWILSENAEDLQEFELGRDRIEFLELDEREKAIRDGVSSLGGQRATIRSEWQSKGRSALSQLDKLWKSYEAAQNSVASVEQADRHGYYPLRKISNRVVDTSKIDGFIPYFDIVVGLCLLVGLFTPVAALAAGGFLFSVFLSQYPPTTGPGSSQYQLIEGMACFVLAATAAGRFAGLDYFIHWGLRRWNFRRPEYEE